MEEHQRLLAEARRTLNDDHPDVLDLRFTGTLALARAGRIAEAKDEWEAQLRDAITVLGERHPHTTKIRAQLEFWGSRE